MGSDLDRRRIERRQALSSECVLGTAAARQRENCVAKSSRMQTSRLRRL